MSEGNVLAAYDLLLEEMQGEIDAANTAGAALMVKGDYTGVKDVMARGEALASIAQNLLGVRAQLKGLVDGVAPVDETKRQRMIAEGRAPEGAKTPEESYRVPILQELIAHDGTARTKQILDGVYERVKDRLNKWDLASQASNAKAIRWRKTAEWCAMHLRQSGLMRTDLPDGTWGISDAGRAWLEEQEDANKAGNPTRSGAGA